MAKEQYVTVELIANPSVKRKFSLLSFRYNNKSNKWRVVEGLQEETQEQTQPPVKKKEVVEPVDEQAAKEVFVTSITEPDTHQEPEIDAPKIKEPVNGLLNELRKQYEEKTGKKPDGRWSIKKLTEEISKL